MNRFAVDGQHLIAFVQPRQSASEEIQFLYEHAAVPCEVVHAEPITGAGEPAPWFMFGGTFIFSSDARFRRAAGHYGAVPLHDHRE